MNQQQVLNDQNLEIISKSTDKNVFKDFLKKGDLSNTRNSRNQTILHLVAMNDNLLAVKFFLKKKYGVFKDNSIEVDQVDKDGYTPLHCAVNQGSFEIARKLLSRGADPNSRTNSGSTPLHLLSKFCYSPKSIKLAKQLIDCGAYINHKDSKQETPLHRATTIGSSASIGSALTIGTISLVSSNGSGNGSGNGAGLLNDNFDYLKLLLYHGANPNIVNRRGRTCQHISIEQGKVDLLELFLMYGADFNKPTSILPSPMEMASTSVFPQIKQFFQERISPNGENILLIEKSVFLGKSISTFSTNGDSFTTGNSTQLYTGKLYITNFRLVFKIDNPNSGKENNNNNVNNGSCQPSPSSVLFKLQQQQQQLSLSSSFGSSSSFGTSSTGNSNATPTTENTYQFPLFEDEEETISLLSISSLRTDDDRDNQTNGELDSNSQSNRESIIVPTNHSDYYFSNSEIITPGNNIIDDYLIGSPKNHITITQPPNNCNNNNNHHTSTPSSSTSNSATINVKSNINNNIFGGHLNINESATNLLNNIINFSKLSSLSPLSPTPTPPLSPSHSQNLLNDQSSINTSSGGNNIITTSISSNNLSSTNNNNSNNNNITMNYQLINIETKDFKQFKLYFMSGFVRDKILELIHYHFKDKIERSIKVNYQNKNIQEKIVKENIQMQDESRIEHIDRYESYGIFEETVPYLFAYLYKLPGFSMINNSFSSGSSGTGGSVLSNSLNASLDGWKIYNQKREYSRFGIFDNNDSANNCSNSSVWKYTNINKDHRMCSSYPTSMVVLSKTTDKELEKIFSFRSKGRIPALSWRDSNTGASISRCSQPLVGIERSRCIEDELYCSNLALSSPSKQLYLIDARPKLNAIANTANGAGFENIHNYPNCKLVFMNIPNIHVIRKSLEKLSNFMKSSTRDKDHAESSDTRWWGFVEETGWISHIKSILEAAAFSADLIAKGNSILIHCSDGWDRTPQLSSITQMLLDPFYRTIYGYQVLIEKEWLSFGHKFSLRLGHLPGNEEERSPIFQQFLDCTFQLCNQYPLLFEFTPSLLLFLSENIHSCKYGTFLNNCEKDRTTDQVRSKTISIWTEVNLNISRFLNPYYNPQDAVIIKPKLYTRCLELWKACYMRLESKDFWMHSNWLLHNSNFNSNTNNSNSNTLASNSVELFKLSLKQQQQQDRSSISSNNSSNNNTTSTTNDFHWISQNKVNSQQQHSPILASHRPISMITQNEKEKENNDFDSDDEDEDDEINNLNNSINNNNSNNNNNNSPTYISISDINNY